MMAGWHAKLMQAAVLPCPLILVLAGCAPTVSRGGAGTPAAGEAPSTSALHARLDALGQKLVQEQQRNTALQAQLSERGQEVEQLRNEVQQLRDREADLRGALERANAGRADGAKAAPPAAAGASEPSADPDHAPEPAPAQSSAPDEGGPVDKAPPGVLVASLRQALSAEQERRQAAETQLARLTEETSTLPYGEGGPLAVDYAAAKQEIVELRRVLDDERAARARLADDLRALQLRAAREGLPIGTASGDNAALDARVEKLQVERQAAVDGFSRSLAASQQRTAELEAELAKARAVSSPAGGDGSGGAPEGEIASIRAENAELRTRLDEEHRRTEELASKLKLATRVTDLIFKMQAQQSAPPARGQ